MNVGPVAVVVTAPKGGALGKFFCSAPHPEAEEVWCRRQPNHPEEHAAFVFSITEPEYWDQEVQL